MKEEVIYFLGIGGIGMSNLARYYLSKGYEVAGYDRTETVLTKTLVSEGAVIHYDDDVRMIPKQFLDKTKTKVIYTPAIPASHSELNYFKAEGFEMMKRAQVLGEITKSSDALCVSGTHGKTTVSSMIAHLLHDSKVGCNAFLGGILKNYNTNLLLSDKSNLTVVEADEYDRSFHWLRPWIAVITSADPDHLDIYGTAEAYRESFEHFTSLIRNDGVLIMKKGAPVTPQLKEGVKLYTYSESEGDFHAEDIRIGNGEIVFDFVGLDTKIKDISLGVPVRINIENAVAAIAVALLSGADEDEIREATSTYGGAKRRFDFIIKDKDVVFIDDYAHHPRELKASIESIKLLYADKKVTGVFQPHLFSRTRDFMNEFAESLSLLDELILLDIYPAREEPIPGVTSQQIFDRVSIENKILIPKENLIDKLGNIEPEVLVTFGAGDIDKLLPGIEKMLRNKYSLDV